MAQPDESEINDDYDDYYSIVVILENSTSAIVPDST